MAIVAGVWVNMVQAQMTGVFANPVVPAGADPWVTQKDGKYYVCQSRGGQGVLVNDAVSLVDIGKGTWAQVWNPPKTAPYGREIWAPELHYLRGKWYVYVAADDGDNAHHRMYVLEGSTQNPRDPFVLKGELVLPENRWAIDGTVAEIGEKLYFVWSGWKGEQNVAQNLYIVEMKDPLTAVGPRVCISRPELEWERRGGKPWINEGPEALWHDGKLFIIYSASGSWCDDYCLGQLAWTGGDPLKPESWVKKSEPVFSRAKDVYGPGHCSFVKSPDGREDWIVYHVAKHSGAGWNRQIHMQRFGWNADGSPDFGAPVAAGIEQALPSGTASVVSGK